MKIALLGNDYTQQFPLIDYGGIEVCVENLAQGMLNQEIDFFTIIPKRSKKESYNFTILETEEEPTSITRKNPSYFCTQAKEIIKQEKPDIIWSQSNWSIDILQDLNIPIICTFHDSCDKKELWIKNYKHVYYRFISKFQYNNWIKEDWERKISFQCYTGLDDKEYTYINTNNNQKYFLWCAGLQWGYQAKGLDIFIELASQNPTELFIAYGSGNDQLADSLNSINLPNFKFLGPLVRGNIHQTVFGNAKALIMPTQIPDTFPRTCLEAISKGTPIIGSDKGSIPEIIESIHCGIICKNMKEYNEAIYNITNINRNNIANKSKIFKIDNEVNTLIEYSKKLIK